MLSARVPEELKALVDADGRNNQEVIEAALWREFGGEKKAALDRRVEEIENRISIVKREKNERNRELESLREKLDALETKKNAAKSAQEKQQQKVIDRCVKKWAYLPESADTEAVKVQAEKAGMEPEAFYEAVKEEFNNA